MCIARRAGKACFKYGKLPQVTQRTKELYKPSAASYLNCPATLDVQKYTPRLQMKNPIDSSKKPPALTNMKKMKENHGVLDSLCKI